MAAPNRSSRFTIWLPDRYWGGIVGALIGREFNGTTVPLAGGALLCGVISLSFVLLAEKGRLFRGQHSSGELPLAVEGAQAEGAGLH